MYPTSLESPIAPGYIPYMPCNPRTLLVWSSRMTYWTAHRAFDKTGITLYKNLQIMYRLICWKVDLMHILNINFVGLGSLCRRAHNFILLTNRYLGLC